SEDVLVGRDSHVTRYLGRGEKLAVSECDHAAGRHPDVIIDEHAILQQRRTIDVAAAHWGEADACAIPLDFYADLSTPVVEGIDGDAQTVASTFFRDKANVDILAHVEAHAVLTTHAIEKRSPASANILEGGCPT